MRETPPLFRHGLGFDYQTPDAYFKKRANEMKQIVASLLLMFLSSGVFAQISNADTILPAKG